MRNISFSMTTQAFLNRTKTVTRRLGWNNLKPGDVLMACEKCQGLKKGEKVKKLGEILIVSVKREALYKIWDNDNEVEKEGFPGIEPDEFIALFCQHNKCDSLTEVNRIEFEYL